MEIGQLYQFALVLVLVGLIVGVGVLILDKFSATEGVSNSAGDALNASRDAIGGIAENWMALIVTIGVLAIILFLVIRSFGIGGRGR